GPPATKTQGCRLLVGRCARPSPAIIRILRLLNSIPVLGNLLFGKLVAHHVPPVERQHAYILLYHASHQCHHAYHPPWHHTRYGTDIMCNRAHVGSRRGLIMYGPPLCPPNSWLSPPSSRRCKAAGSPLSSTSWTRSPDCARSWTRRTRPARTSSRSRTGC